MRTLLVALASLVALFAAGLARADVPVAAPTVPVVFAAYATPLEEPWNQVIHQALVAAQQAGRITYTWQDKLASQSAMGQAIRAAVAQRPNVVFADAVEGDAEIRPIAAANPGIAFVIATSTAAPAPPNLSVFDGDLSDPAYLCGITAGKLTASGIVGVVAGKSDVQANRAVNGFIRGVKDTNPAARVKVTYIESWYDPPRARQAALEQIAAGADLIYAEREGAIAAAKEKGVLAFGHLVDQHAEAPGTVVTGPVWSMEPLVDHIVKQASAGMIRGESLHDFSSAARGGAMLAPWREWAQQLPAEVIELVREKQVALKTGALVVNPRSERAVGD